MNVAGNQYIQGAGPGSCDSPLFGVTAINATSRSAVYAVHGTIISVTMADGSTRSVDSSVTAPAFASMGTWQRAIFPADGGALGPDW